MSSLQTGFGGNGWGADGYQPPQYLDDYDDPVIRSTRSSRKGMHAPDLRSEEVRPACDVGNRDTDMSWVADERDHLEGFYTVCGNPECQQFFGGEE